MDDRPTATMKMRRIATVIDGFRDAGLVISGHYFELPLLLSPDPIPMPGLTIADVTAATFSRIEKGVEVVLVGMGPRFGRLPAHVLEAAHANGLRAEAMDSHAAARTFNLLWVEGREVAALLL